MRDLQHLEADVLYTTHSGLRYVRRFIITGHVKWGIAVPQRFVGEAVDVPLVTRFVSRAEELGYDSLWVVDHLLGPRNVSFLDPLTLLAHVATVTTRPKMGTAVLALPLHHPYHLARSAATVDQLSNGRLILGVGLGAATGGRAEEETQGFLGVGTPEGRRVARFLDHLHLLKAFWTEPSVTHHGEFWHFDELDLDPKPVQTPHIPIWFGGQHPNMIRRAARHASGWQAVGDVSHSQYLEALSLLEQTLQQQGRDRSSFTVNQKLFVAVDKDGNRARQKLGEWFEGVIGFSAERAASATVGGTADEVVDRLGRSIESGADLITLNHVFSPREFAEQMEIYARDVVPQLSK